MLFPHDRRPAALDQEINDDEFCNIHRNGDRRKDQHHCPNGPVEKVVVAKVEHQEQHCKAIQVGNDEKGNPDAGRKIYQNGHFDTLC